MTSKMNIKIIYGVLMIGLLTATGASAMPWSWDFFDQPSYKAQEDTPPPTPEGIVPTTGHPFYVMDRDDADVRLVNPEKATRESLERGKYKYDIHCLPCHGASGAGDGLVGKKFPLKPADLSNEYYSGKSAGDLFYTITYGGVALMPPYGDSMDPADRWHIVNYIQQVLSGKVKLK